MTDRSTYPVLLAVTIGPRIVAVRISFGGSSKAYDWSQGGEDSKIVKQEVISS